MWVAFAWLHTFRRETEPRRHCRNEGWIRAVAERHCRHDMVICVAVEKNLRHAISIDIFVDVDIHRLKAAIEFRLTTFSGRMAPLVIAGLIFRSWKITNASSIIYSLQLCSNTIHFITISKQNKCSTHFKLADDE